MSYVAKGDKEFQEGAAPAVKNHKIRITLTSRNVKNLEKGKFTIVYLFSSLVTGGDGERRFEERVRELGIYAFNHSTKHCSFKDGAERVLY